MSKIINEKKDLKCFGFNVLDYGNPISGIPFRVKTSYFLGYLAGSIMKLDVEKKELTQTWDDPNCRATEPQFVPRPGSTLEDDGVVVFVCLGTSQENPNTALVVLDPDLQELGRYSVPFATPVAFHGVWLP